MTNEREIALQMLEHLKWWCKQVDEVGTGWDDWDHWYKQAHYTLIPQWEQALGVEATPKEETVTVCSACLKASCWQGEFYCEQYKTAGTVEKTRSELEALNVEHSDYWSRDRI